MDPGKIMTKPYGEKGAIGAGEIGDATAVLPSGHNGWLIEGVVGELGGGLGSSEGGTGCGSSYIWLMVENVKGSVMTIHEIAANWRTQACFL